MRWLLVLALSHAAAQHQQAAAAEQAAWVPHVQRGFAAQSAGRWQDAVAAYTAAVDSGTVPADHQLSVASNLGLALQNVGRLDEALSWFDKVLRAHPSNADAHHNRGNVLYLQQRHAEAADAFGRAVALVPTDAESVFNQGNALAKMGHHAAAAAAFASVLRLTPRDAHASYNYANSLSAAGNTAEAISAYKATLRLSPQHSAAQTNLGLQLSAAGRYTEAAAALATAVELAPRDSASHVALGYARKSDPAAAAGGAEEAFRAALALEPTLSSAYLGLASVLKATDPVSAVAAFGAAGRGEEAISGAEALGAWLDRLEMGEGSAVAVREAAAGGGTQATAQGAPGAGPTLDGLSLDGPSLDGPISAVPISDGPVYPDVFEQAPRCASLPFGDVNTAGGAAALLQGGRPLLLRNATAGWRANAWDDGHLFRAVGTEVVEMLVMPTVTHPTIDAARDALVEPARVPVYMRDFLRLCGGKCPQGGGKGSGHEAGRGGGSDGSEGGGGVGGGGGDGGGSGGGEAGGGGGGGGASGCLSSRVEFEAYIAQLNLLRLPELLAGICLPLALPASHLAVANLWIGGALMKNGLHFDLYDNLLFQLRGTKRALLFPPADAAYLYYGPADVRRHGFDAAEGRVKNETEFDRVRHNVAKLNVFAPNVATTHPKVAASSPMVCELHAGEALFLPRGWHHAVISTSPVCATAREAQRNLAVNLWYESSMAAAGARLSSVEPLFQAEGCPGHGHKAPQGGGGAKQEL